jgi:hypothetical protein
MKTTYKFQRVYRGVVYFAEITLQLRLVASDDEILSISADKSDELDSKVPRIWREEALSGVRLALRKAKIFGKWVVIFHAIRGTYTDTTPDALRAAAGLACLKELGINMTVSKKPPWTLEAVPDSEIGSRES